MAKLGRPKKTKENSHKRWTNEDIQYLEEKIGEMSLSAIARKLKRTPSSVKIKCHRLGLIPTISASGISITELAECFHTHRNVVRNWIYQYGLPYTEKCPSLKNKIKLIEIDDFWNWAEKNKDKIPWMSMESYILGAEPDWLLELRNSGNLRYIKRVRQWDKKDDALLEQCLKDGLSFKEIEGNLNRSIKSIKSRIQRLKLNRYIKPQPHGWTTEEQKIIIDSIKKNLPYKEIKLLLPHRSMASIHKQGRKIKYSLGFLEEKKQKKIWKPEEEELLLQMKQEGYSLTELSNYFKVSYKSIQSKLVRLRKVSVNISFNNIEEHSSARYWTPEEEAKLIELYTSGASIEQMESILDRTYRGIEFKLNKLNLKVKNKHSRYWSFEEELHAITLYRKKMTIKDIALNLKKSESTVTKKLAKYKKIYGYCYHKFSFDDNISHEFTIDIFKEEKISVLSKRFNVNEDRILELVSSYNSTIYNYKIYPQLKC